MKDFKICSASGILGYNFPEDSLKRAMEMNPDMIGCDAGSVDPGPYYLGSGTAFVARSAAKRDIELLIKASVSANIPLVIGSAGGGGGDLNVKFMTDIIEEVVAENNLHFKMAVIYCEQDKDFLKAKLKMGKINSMGYFPELTDEIIDESNHTVRLMGPYGIQKAFNMGADVIIAGRTSDTALFAAIPLMKGYEPGLVWHAAKILECGAASCEPLRSNDTIIATITDDCFYVEPMNPILKHTKLSVAAHGLFENSSPFCYFEPNGMLDLTEAKFEQFTDRIVKVYGSKMVPAKHYTEKLESTAFRGYRTISIMATRDPILIKCLDEYEKTIRKEVEQKVQDAYNNRVKKSDYIFNLHIYGRNAVMGVLEPVKEIKGHEVCVLLEVIAATTEISSSILAFARTSTLHNGFPGRKCTAGNMAIAFSPSDIPVGPVYEFNMEHLLTLEDPLEGIRFEMKEY